MTTKSRIAILSVGGTIAMTRASAGQGVTPQLTAADLLAMLPGIEATADLMPQSVMNVASCELTFAALVDLANGIRELAASGVDGVVLTQGTDTIEESSYFLDLILDLEIPVVVTGAMRNPSELSPDGPANLRNAILLASSDEARNRGVLVVMNDEVHAARFVAKAHTSKTSAFVSRPFAPLGWISEGQLHLSAKSPRAPSISLTQTTNFDIFVPVIPVGLSDQGQLLAAALMAGCDGLILEGVGGGHVPVKVRDMLGSAPEAIPVILTSRTADGCVLQKTYGYPGSEMDLLGRGLLHGGRLSSLKARILLSTLLLSGENRATIDLSPWS